MKPIVCLIEDDVVMGESLFQRFEIEGFNVDWHVLGESAAVALTSRRYDVVVSDIRLPDIDGGELFHRLVRQGVALPPFILITAYATVERAVSLMKSGIADYITKPFDLSGLVEKVRAAAQASPSLPKELSEQMLGVSEAARDLARRVPRIAGRASSILITGESGVGKEMLARMLHQHAVREEQNTPFVTVNCGAVAPNLLEAEFFGFERGAFTGADRTRRGFLEQAHGGTLLLDEVGELSLPMQAALLRALQEKRIRRVGAETDLPVQFDLICATNRDLEKMVKERQFREDLYYRINVVSLHVSPLRDRPDDVMWFAERFMEAMASRLNEPLKTLHPMARLRLLEHNWPGNVRELHNRIEHACLMSTGSMLMPADIFPSDVSHPEGLLVSAKDTSLGSYKDACERIYIKETLRHHGGRVEETAKALRISRKSLWEKLKRHRIDRFDVG